MLPVSPFCQIVSDVRLFSIMVRTGKNRTKRAMFINQDATQIVSIVGQTMTISISWISHWLL